MPFCTEECARAHLVVEFPYPIEKAGKEAVAMLHRELRKEREEDRQHPPWDFIERVHDRLETLVSEAEKARDDHTHEQEQRRLVQRLLGSHYRLGAASVDPESPAVVICATCGAEPAETTPHKAACLTGKMEEVFGRPDLTEVQAALDTVLKIPPAPPELRLLKEEVAASSGSGMPGTKEERDKWRREGGKSCRATIAADHETGAVLRCALLVGHPGEHEA